MGEVSFLGTGLRVGERELTFVDGVPPLHPVPESCEGDPGIVDKVSHDLLGEPTAVLVLQSQRRIPMIECDDGRDVVLQASVDHIVVVRDGQLIDWSPSERHDTAPREGEGVRFHAHGRDAGDV